MKGLSGRMRPTWAAWVCAGLAGLMQALSLAWPWGGQALGTLQALSLAALVGLLNRAPSARHGAWLGVTSPERAGSGCGCSS